MQDRDTVSGDITIDEERNLSVDPNGAAILALKRGRLAFDDAVGREHTCHRQTCFLDELEMNVPFRKQNGSMIIDVFLLKGTNILLCSGESYLLRGMLLIRRRGQRTGAPIAGVFASNDIWMQ